MVDALHFPKHNYARKTRKNTADPNFSRYYADVGRTRVLSPEEERSLFLEYQRTNSIAARNKLVENCLRFVVTLASRYACDLDQLKDLISAGNEGALHALKRYDPTRGTRFLSYATYWILLYIRNEQSNQELVTMPTWRQKTIRRVKKAHAELCSEGQTNVDDETHTKLVCSRTQITPEQLEDFRVDRFHYRPYDNNVAPTNGTFNKVANNRIKEMVHGFIETLPPKERFVIRGYFGLVTDPMSLGQIGSVLQITSERVRQIRETVLARFQKYVYRELGITTGKKKTDAEKDDDRVRAMRMLLDS